MTSRYPFPHWEDAMYAAFRLARHFGTHFDVWQGTDHCWYLAEWSESPKHGH